MVSAEAPTEDRHAAPYASASTLARSMIIKLFKIASIPAATSQPITTMVPGVVVGDREGPVQGGLLVDGCGGIVQLLQIILSNREHAT